MNKDSLKMQISSCCDPSEPGGYYEFMHPNYFIRFICDWRLNPKNPTSDEDFWIASLGKPTSQQKESAKKLVNFLSRYKIRGVGGEEKEALSTCQMLAIKQDDEENLEIFWLFHNGTNGLDGDFLPAAEECLELIRNLRKKEFVKDAYLLSSGSDPADDLYSWYIKIIV